MHIREPSKSFPICKMGTTKGFLPLSMQTLVLIAYLFTLALSSANDRSAAPSPITMNRQALTSLQNRGSSGASNSHRDPLICLRFKGVTKILPLRAGATALTALYSYLHASASNSWANQPYLQSIIVNYGRLQLHMYSPLTTIPWSFVASFAMEMLQAIPRGNMYVSLYEGFYSSPASCAGLWDAVYATAQGDNLVWVALRVVDDRGHFFTGRWGTKPKPKGG